MTLHTHLSRIVASLSMLLMFAASFAGTVAANDHGDDMEPIGLEANYDPERGYGFTSADGNYEFRFTGLLQARAIHTEQFNDDRSDRWNFEVQRGRIAFQGSVFTSKLTYKFEYDGAWPYDSWRDYYVNYAFMDEVQVQMGHFKVPFNRHELMPASRMMFIERSEISNISPDAAVYQDPNQLRPQARDMSYRWDTGIMLHGKALEELLAWYLAATNGDDPTPQSTSGVISAQQDVNFPPGSEPRWTVRLEASPLGPIDAGGNSLEIYETPRFSVGFAYTFEKEHRPSQTSGLVNSDAMTGDIAVRWQGLAFNAEIHSQSFETHVEPQGQPTPEANWEAFIMEAGYLLPVLDRKLEVAGRLAKVTLLRQDQGFLVEPSQGAPRRTEREYGVGLNYYVYGHHFKISVDQIWTIIEYDIDNFPGVDEKQNRAMTRFQMQVWI